MSSLNTTVVTGNVTNAGVTLRETNAGPVANFTVAVSHRIKRQGEWVDSDPVFKDIAVWREPAHNAADTIKPGMRVTVVGVEKDASYTPAGSDRRVYRVVVEAEEVSVSIRFATAEVTKTGRRTAPAGSARAADRREPASVG